MRRATGILLLISLFGATSGLLRYIHLQEHVHGAVVSADNRVSLRTPGEAGHDEESCLICVTLHMPMAGSGYTPLLVFLGLFIAFLTLLTHTLAPQRVCRATYSRGPPRA